MKKLLVLLFAISAIALTSCNSATTEAIETSIDSITVADTTCPSIDTCAVKVDSCVVK